MAIGQCKIEKYLQNTNTKCTKNCPNATTKSKTFSKKMENGTTIVYRKSLKLSNKLKSYVQKKLTRAISERYLVRKISKNHFYFKKNLRESEGLQSNLSGGSEKNLKKSLFCQKKISKSHFFVPKKSQKVTFMSKKNLKKSLLCQPDAKGGLQMRYLCNAACQGWAADAVPLQRSSMSEFQNVAKKSQGGPQMWYLCSIAVCPRINK